VELVVPVYYFHLRDGEDVLLDPEGAELDDIRAIRKSALRQARALISSDALEGVISLKFYIDVHDSAGKVVYSLPFEDAVEIQRGPAEGELNPAVAAAR
jgi:hypothetical protein